MTPKRAIEIIFAHPAFEKSRVNRVLIEAARGIEGVTVHDLYEAYPDMYIDGTRERELLLAHDFYIFHHPFYWYAAPAILKEWQDLVLTHGWAYGRTGTALKGKQMLSTITTGGKEEAYAKEGHNRFTVQQFLTPIDQTATLCGIEYFPPFVVHGTHSLKPQAITTHGRDYGRFLEAIRDDRIDMDAMHRSTRVNADLDALISEKGAE
jgi:glutathione-regulated potassium-efflux system ancillary protein KefG